MNRDDIIRMAREAGLWEMLTSFSNEFGNANPEEDCMKELERFAALVAATEREACAKVCEKDATAWGYDSNGASCAIAIRARGKA
jgi:hypothetical protein